VGKESTLAGIFSIFSLEYLKKTYLSDNEVDGIILYYHIFQIKGEGVYELGVLTPSYESDIELPISHNRLGISQSTEQIEVPHKGLILLGSIGILISNTEKYCPPLLAFLRVHRIDPSCPYIIFVGGSLRMGH
jgi:high-affinity Fe2+/Pb2+ permease